MVRSGTRWLGAAVGLVVGAYVSSVGITWCRYGHAKRKAAGEARESQLDNFIPEYEVVERHAVRVAAPVGIAFAAACEMDIQRSAIVRAIFNTRAFVLGSAPEQQAPPQGLVDQARAWGWGVLAEREGSEIVFGAVTQPWRTRPTFRALPPDEFRRFHDPGYVKIAWTLRADPIDATKSMVRTETRAITTDPGARRKFRGYWSLVLPGIVLIRRMGLQLVKKDAERVAGGAIVSENIRLG